MRIIFIASDDEVSEWKRQAEAVRMNFSVYIRARLNGLDWEAAKKLAGGIPRGEELATGEASARSNGASGEVASRRLPKAAKPQKSIPAELPIRPPVDMSKFLP